MRHKIRAVEGASAFYWSLCNRCFLRCGEEDDTPRLSRDSCGNRLSRSVSSTLLRGAIPPHPLSCAFRGVGGLSTDTECSSTLHQYLHKITIKPPTQRSVYPGAASHDWFTDQPLISCNLMLFEMNFLCFIFHFISSVCLIDDDHDNFPSPLAHYQTKSPFV